MFLSPPPQPPKQVVIWVHGTRMQEHIAPKSAKNKLFGKLSYSPSGLHAVDNVDKTLHLRKMAETLHTADPEHFDTHHTYLFGWSGKLRSIEREKAALALYTALKSLQSEYENMYKVCPPIMMITHSHGGNVALNLATIPENNITIDNLVLLACPVQKETAHLITSPLFTRVYSLHSHRDAVQVLDPQGLHLAKKAFEKVRQTSFFNAVHNLFRNENNNKLFSERHFNPHATLKQAAIEWKTKAPWAHEDLHIFGNQAHTIKKVANLFDKKRRGLLHLEFVLPSFIKKLPDILSDLDNIKQNNNTKEITIQL